MGKLIIFEGLDGSGKGTQAELACQNLHSKGYDRECLCSFNVLCC